MLRKIIALVALCVAGLAHGQIAPFPANAPIVATGATTARTVADRAADTMNVADFGAKGDCLTDDTAAFNAYAAYLRNLTGYLQYSRKFALGHNKCYILNGSVNLTALPFTLFEGNGSTLVGGLATYSVIDAIQSPQLVFQNFTLISNGSGTIGIQIGRALNGYSGAQSNNFNNVFVDGTWSTAAVYNRASETSVFVNVFFQNRSSVSTSYALIMDGDASYPIHSLYASTYNSGNPTIQDALYTGSPVSMSFNENTFYGGTISAYNTSALWMSNYGRHSYFGTFLGASSISPGTVIAVNGSEIPKMLYFDVHSENPTSDIQISGTTTNPIIDGLDYRNHYENVTGSVFSLGAGVAGATIHNLNLRTGSWLHANLSTFDNPSNWAVDGTVYISTPSTWTAPSSFSGVANLSGSMTYYGALSASVSLPSPANIAQIISNGSITSIAPNTSSSYFLGGASVASLTISPPASGTTATASINSIGVVSPLPSIVSGGSGYAVNDVVSIPSCSTANLFKVSSVSAGVVTGVTSNLVVGVCPASTSTLSASATTSSGSGTGLILNLQAVTWRVLSVTVNSGGSGYSGPPTITISRGSFVSQSITQNASFTAQSANGQMLLNSAGTTLGIAGASGGPVISAGALIDNSGVRQSLGATYTVPANTSLVRFIQGSTVATSTVTLPTALADGQSIQFVNYAGSITALTFSPTVLGWTNGSTLAAYTGLRLRWDATSAAWIREQ